LVYEKNGGVTSEVNELAGRYAATIKSLSGGELEARKGEILEVLRSFKYLAKWNLVPAGFPPLAVLEAVERAQGWDDAKKKKSS
jgi:hypothetical protein